MLPTLILKQNEDRRLRAGHPWVFSNEVDVAKTPLTGFEPGQGVEIVSASGHSLGCGYVNPHSLICARLVTRRPGYLLDRALLDEHLQQALRLRQRLYDRPFYRLAYGDGDLLPGLIVDRFDDVFVIQCTTAGMERVLDDVIDILIGRYAPRAIVLRNDSSIRQLEGLENYVRIAHGALAAPVMVEENGSRFEIDPVAGQKTGWFFDHRDNRARMKAYVQNRRVLDVFSYGGGWAIQAAAAGASGVVCVDSSARALELLARNAVLNDVQDKIQTICDDAFDALKALHQDGQRFDVVITDPPAFIKRRKDNKAGEQAYRRLNQLAMQLLSPEGILIAASCSYHMSAEMLGAALLGAARHLDRQLQIIEQGHQGRDHPLHPAIPETGYLKAFFCRVLPAR